MTLQKKQWFAIYVRSRAEKKVGESLNEIGIENYVPLKQEWRQWSDRKKLVELPVISGYVFVKIAINERLTVLNCPNVLQFVRYLGEDAVIRDIEIDNLKLFLNQADVNVEMVSGRIKLGSQVEVVEGPFVGFEGEMVQHNGKEKVVVRLDALQSNFLVKIESSKLTVKEVC
ncbi:MAG: UpxY family transcription antiterminator [Prolixibacteraceae bacterium]|jgi:transcription antitermination factor NusG|nr:UpxY family transcription antiterminator [Prolixibacteraceae bacterium]